MTVLHTRRLRLEPFGEDRLGMRYRGMEVWYGKTLATHVLRREDWQCHAEPCDEA